MEGKMETLQFANGDQMPILGLGTWKSTPGEVYKAVKEALRIGYRHIDCAPIYGNEAEVGQALADSFKEGVTSRDQLWITSKLWNNSHAPENVQPSLEKTLSDLQIDSLDLYLIHWPVVLRKEVLFHESVNDLIALDDLPISETWPVMEAMVDKGLCKHIGVSNFSVAKLKELLENSRLMPEMNQIELHPYLQQPAMLKFCKSNGIHLTGYAPLGSADRPERLKVEDEPILLEEPAITTIAERHGITPAQLVLSWAIHRRTAVIPKSVNPGRLKQNLSAAEVSLAQDDMPEMARLDRHRRYVSGTFWAMEGGPYTIANLWDE
jgi:alcohol dehydrogenase (NADP+)